MLAPLARTLLLTTLLTASTSPAAAQQTASIHMPSVRTTGLAATCRQTELVPDPFLDRVSQILASPGDHTEVDHELRRMEADARRDAEADRGDVAAAYRLAAVLGARTDLAEGREQLALGNELHRRVRRVLELDPDHPGGHHILGRLNAAVMRIGGFKRFLAKHLIGGDVLDAASWERARHHLEAAEAGDPCLPDHHYELARLYVERGEPRRGWEEVGHVLTLTAHDRSRWTGIRGKAEALTDAN